MIEMRMRVRIKCISLQQHGGFSKRNFNIEYDKKTCSLFPLGVCRLQMTDFNITFKQITSDLTVTV